MKLALVIGKAVAEEKHPTFEKRTTLLCRPLNLDLEPEGPPIIAMDTVGAGEGEVVLIIQEGRSARDFTQNPHAATRTMIVGIVDRLDRYEE
ncbi:MAG: ethanolamine utilization protein EutN [Candidatus Hydrogenedentota bacterium]|nr:MAG: ethanolamine utilization protein EutN [Candidatus Hydrogenedentota bacterium]